MPAGGNLLSGLTGHVLVAGTEYAFKKWSCAIETRAVTRNNFTSAGFQRIVSGFTKATITLEGPYDGGNMPLTSGTQYQFTLQWTATLSIVITGQVTRLTPDDDAEEAPNISVEIQSHGTFTAAVT